MKNDHKLTIILMCYNEAAHIEKTIANILSQKTDSMSLIIGDNNSTDGSRQILERILKNATNTELIFRPENIGALENFNDLCARVRTEYLIFAGAHDLWSDNYLSSLLLHIEATPTCAIAYAPTKWIGKNDEAQAAISAELPTTGLNLLKRFILISISNQHYVNGIIRTNLLMKTRLNLPIIGSFEVCLQELSSLGTFDLVQGVFWLRRRSREQKTRLQILQRYRNSLFGFRKKGIIFNFFPSLQYLTAYLMLPLRLPSATITERLALMRESVFVVIRKFPRYLIVDLIYITNKLLRMK